MADARVHVIYPGGEVPCPLTPGINTLDPGNAGDLQLGWHSSGEGKAWVADTRVEIPFDKVEGLVQDGFDLHPCPACPRSHP